MYRRPHVRANGLWKAANFQAAHGDFLRVGRLEGDDINVTSITAIDITAVELIASVVTANVTADTINVTTLTGDAGTWNELYTTDLDVVNALTAGGATLSGPLTAPSAGIAGLLTAGSAAVSGTLSAGATTLTGPLTAPSAGIAGALTAGSAAVSGTLSAGATTLTGHLTAPSADIAGLLTAGSFSTSSLVINTLTVTGLSTLGPTIIDRTVFVTTVADLPAAVGGVHTLAPLTTYVLTRGLDLAGNRIVMGPASSLHGTFELAHSLTSTGLGVGVPLISSLGPCDLWRIAIGGVDTAIDIETGGNPLALRDVFFNGIPNIGRIANVSFCILDFVNCLDSAGLRFEGTFVVVVVKNAAFRVLPGGTGVTFPAGLVVDSQIIVSTMNFTTTAPSTCLAFDVAGGPTAEDSVVIKGSTFNLGGGGTAVTGIADTELRANFHSNVNVQPSRSIGWIYVVNNAVLTPIAAVNTPALLASAAIGTGMLSRFTLDAARHGIRHVATTRRLMDFMMTMTINGQGNNRVLQGWLGIAPAGGAPNLVADRVPGATSIVETDGARPQTMTIFGTAEIGLNDLVYPTIANTTNGADILVTNMQLRVGETAAP